MLELVPGSLRIIVMRSCLDVRMRPINEDTSAEHGRHQPEVPLEVLVRVCEVGMKPDIIRPNEEIHLAHGPLDPPIIVT